MQAIFQQSCTCSVRRKQNELTAYSAILNTELEATASMVVNVSSFEIKSARWDVYRTQHGYTETGREITELNGIEAFMHAGPEVRKRLSHEMNGLVVDLMNECIKGLIQAETYVYTERGYATAKEYDEYWRTFNNNYCRYFKNIDRLSSYWTEYLGDCLRKDNLFHRNLQSSVFRIQEGNYMVTGQFIDSFHEIGLFFEANEGGKIIDCSGNLLRAPDPVCFENDQHLSKLKGKNILAPDKKELALDLGGPEGCYHILDMITEMSKALKAALR